MSHAVSRPASSSSQRQDQSYSHGCARSAAAAPAPAHATVEPYYEQDDLDCNDCSETECETPSDRSQVVKRTAAEQVYKQMYYQRPPDVQYVPMPDVYYGAPAQPRFPYRYATAAGQAYAPVTPLQQLRKAPVLRQATRLCTAPPQMHPYYQHPQYAAIPQPSYDGMSYAASSTEGMGSVPVVPMPQVMYQQPQGHHVPIVPTTSRIRGSINTASVGNLRSSPGPAKKSISVRTPRYIRRSGPNSALYKKPSALCLPLAYETDPAVNPRKQSRQASGPEQEYHARTGKVQGGSKRSASKNAAKEQSQNASLTAELQPTLSQSQLDALFANYEELYLKATAQGGAAQPKGKIMATMMGLGPPRVPLHIQKRREELLRPPNKDKDESQTIQDRGDSKEQSKSFTIPKDAETFDVQEITSQVLQQLMSDMNTELAENLGTMGDKMTDELLNETDTTDFTKRDVNETHIDKTIIDLHRPVKHDNVLGGTVAESFNYRDIAQNISKSKSAFHEEDEDLHSTATTQKQSTTPSMNQLKASDVESRVSQVRRMSSQKSMKSLKSLKCSRVTNVAEAMELHRTKSYVVNLIDTALSNHFGTSVCDKYSSYECSGMNPVNLIETLKKHSVPKLEKDVCIEIAQALNQTPYDKTDGCVEDGSKQGSCCSCKGEAGEPTYIKYLRQLRWGHLKHIQAEAKRLEELERFFDSCSKKAFCEKYP